MYNIYVNGVFTESFITEDEARAYGDTVVKIKYEHTYEKLVKATWPFPTASQLDLFTGEYPVVYKFPTESKP